MQIETTAYGSAEQMPDQYYNLKEIPKEFNHHTIFNRETDSEWLKEKATWLFETAGISLPPLSTNKHLGLISDPTSWHIMRQRMMNMW